MNPRQKQYSSDTLFSFLLLLIFTVFTLLLAGTGAAVYKNSMAKLDENYTSRTAIAYVSEKFRQHDSAGAVELTVLPGSVTTGAATGDTSADNTSDAIPALALRDTIDGEQFVTYVYYYDGALRELFVRETTSVSPEMGSRIVELESCTFEHVEDVSSAGSLLRVTAVSTNGNELSLLIHPSAAQKSYN